MRNHRFIYYFLFFLFAAAAAMACFPQRAAASGIGVSPSSIDFFVEKGSSASRQLIIYNTGPASVFTATSEDSAIAVEPGSGLLGEGKATAIRVTATGRKIRRSSSEIMVSLIPDSANAGREVRLSLGTRVGVSLTVIESAAQSANFFVGMLTSAAIVISGLSAYIAARRKNAWLPPAKA